MTCAICKVGDTKPGCVTVTLERALTTPVVLGVPAQICSNCGEDYVDEEAIGRLLSLLEAAAGSGVELEVRQYEAA